jgi:carbonic anhydrase
VREDPGYFTRLSNLQTPKFLWIGCSDSRVPANQITGTDPGEIFVHRNIANLVVHTDINLLSVLEYAVTQLKVEHVIVCGHYGCGGVLAAMQRSSFGGVLNKWLRNIKDVFRLHEAELLACADETTRARMLVEFNVQEQVLNLAKTSILQKAWKYEHRPVLHGWVYGLEDGLIKPLVDMQPGHDLHPLYRYENL